MKTEQETKDLKEKLIKDRDQAMSQVNMLIGAIQACDLMLADTPKESSDASNGTE